MTSQHPDDRIFDFNDRNPGFDAEIAYAEREREKNRSGCCSCGCCLGCFGFLVLIALGCAALYYSIFTGGVPLEVRVETTVITEPLKDDGTVDFHQAIQAMIQPDVQPDENSFMSLWRGYGRQIYDAIDRGDAGQQHLIRRQYRIMCEYFEIDPLAPPTWANAGEGLDAVRTAVAGPHYFVPLVRQNERDFVAMSQPIAIYAFHEYLSDSLRQRARDRFATNDTADAWQDMLASIRLFRRVTVHQAWLAELAGRNSESLLTPVAEIVATLPQWTPEQLEQAIRDLDTLPDWMDRQTILTTVQFSLLDMLSASHDFPGVSGRLGMVLPGDVRLMLRTFQRVGFDWNLTAIELNRNMEAYSELVDRVAGNNIEEQFNLLHLRRIGAPPFRMPNEDDWQAFTVEYFQAIEGNPFFVSEWSKAIGAMMGHLGILVTQEMHRLQLIEDLRIQALRSALEAERDRRAEGQ